MHYVTLKYDLDNIPVARKRQLTNETRQSIITCRSVGLSFREIAKQIKVPLSPVVSYTINWHLETGRNSEGMKSGRAKVTSQSEDKFLRVTSWRDHRRLTAQQLNSAGRQKPRVSLYCEEETWCCRFDRVIPPRGKSSFKVIFLPTKEGSVENVLFINTSSHGIISYQEEALNSSRLWLQLECNIPKRGVHYSQDSCFVEEENLLVQVHLFDKNRRNEGFEKLEHYINENVFVLFVLKGNNIIEEPKITIYLLNSGARLLQAKEIKLVSQSKGLFEIEQSLLRPSASKFTQIASLVCRATQTPSGREKKGSGEMTMRVLKGSSTLKSYPSLHLSYRSFEHEAAPTLFDLKNKDAEEDLIDIWLTNGFDFSFTLDKVQFPKEADKFLKVLNFSSPVLVPPGCWKMFTLQYVNRIDFASVVANIILVTSHGFSLEMPLQIKSTMLKVKYFTLKNPVDAPVTVQLLPVSSYPEPHEALNALIKWNNLTVFDIVLVKGCGTKEILKIGGRLPGTGASLRFNVPQSTLMQCRNGLKSSKPFVVQKTFTLENAGELPLTITSMSISGYKCQGFGFEILGCRILPLDYNSTQEISIVGKGSCKTFTDSGNTPDKGKGKGSLSVTSGNCRTQTSSKKSPGTFAQSQKKYKVSLYYSKYKVNPTSSAIAAASSMSSQDEECLPVKEPYNQGDHIDENTNKICAIENKNTVLQESEVHSRHGVSLAVKDCRNINTDMFPMETNIKPSEELSVATNNSPNHWPCSSVEKKDSDQVSDDQQCSTFLPFPEKKIVEKRDIGVGKRRGSHGNQQLLRTITDADRFSPVHLGEKHLHHKLLRNRFSHTPPRPLAKLLTEQNISDFSDKSRDAVNKETKNPNRSRNRCTNGKQESVKLCGKVDSPLKHLQNRDDHVFAFLPDKECCQPLNSSYRIQSVHNLNQGEKCHIPESVPTLSFASVASGVERNMTLGPCQSEEIWSPMPTALTNGFRYNTSENMSFIPPENAGAIYSHFPWTTSQYAAPYHYSDQNGHCVAYEGNMNFQNAFQEVQNVQYTPQAFWNEESPPDLATSWDSNDCIGSKEPEASPQCPVCLALFGLLKVIHIKATSSTICDQYLTLPTQLLAENRVSTADKSSILALILLAAT
ncbi:T131L protein, partial [Polypterus senegalus]